MIPPLAAVRFPRTDNADFVFTLSEDHDQELQSLRLAQLDKAVFLFRMQRIGNSPYERTRFVAEPEIGDEETSSSELPATEQKARRPFYVGGVIPRDEVSDDDDAPRVKVIVQLAPVEPFLFDQNVLRNLWEQAVAAQDRSMSPRASQRTIPVGPYELAVVPTGLSRSAIRAGSAVRAVLQGMQQRGKEIEIFTPSALTWGTASRTVIAVWLYQNASAAIAYFDFQYKERFILWNAPDACQINYDYAEGLSGDSPPGAWRFQTSSTESSPKGNRSMRINGTASFRDLPISRA